MHSFHRLCSASMEYYFYFTVLPTRISDNIAARLAQLGERRSAEQEAVGSNPGRTSTQGL